jgi:hypothetical protein
MWFARASLARSISILTTVLGFPQQKGRRCFVASIDWTALVPGNGLGLSLVAAIASLHQIGIALSDNAPGLRVTLRFPAFAAKRNGALLPADERS